MSRKSQNYGRLILHAAIVVFALPLGAKTSHAVEIFQCTSWPNSSLSHRGEVTIALDEDFFTWRADTASSTADVIRIQDGTAAYIDEAFIYLVFGSSLFWGLEMLELPRTPITVRRIPLVKSKAQISEIECR